MAQFSNTMTKHGLLQLCEFWSRFPDAGITGDATLLAIFTGRINSAFEKIMPLLLSYNDQIRWDDTSHSDKPVGKVNIVSGQNDYKITKDDNTLDILNINRVRILQSSSATDYYELERMTADDPYATSAITPNSFETGIPTHFLELGPILYLYPEPNYAATNGIEIFFGREQYYFLSTDTTKEPGIPKPFHELLALYASLDWNLVNRTDDSNLINRLEARIQKIEKDLKNFIDLRHPVKVKITTAPVKFR